MTETEKEDLRALLDDKRFLAFLYRQIRAAGVFAIPAREGRPLEFIEGRRSLVLDMLAEIEAVQPVPSPDGLPVATSIQIFLSVAQSSAKEKALGRRSDIYGDLSGDGSGE